MERFEGQVIAYLVFAIPALLLAALFYSFARTDIRYVPQPDVPAATNGAPMTSVVLSLALIFTIAILNGFIYRGIVTFLPLYLGERVSGAFKIQIASY